MEWVLPLELSNVIRIYYSFLYTCIMFQITSIELGIIQNLQLGVQDVAGGTNVDKQINIFQGWQFFAWKSEVVLIFDRLSG